MAVAALSLGIAANTAIFSVVNKVLLEPLPYPDPDRLLQLASTSAVGDQLVVSIPKYEVWRDHATAFESMAAYDTTAPNVNLTEAENPQLLEAAHVSADYFQLFGARMAVGQSFTKKDEAPNARLVAVIGWDLWRGRFHAGPRVVGSSISLDHEPCKVIGVLAPGFRADKPVDIWLPLPAGSSADHMNRIRVAARLKPGVTVAMAAADVADTMRWFVRKYPYPPLLYLEQFTAIPLRDALVGDIRPALFLLSGAMGFLLLMACANVGGLVLARARRRSPEIATRTALGASRTQLLRQLLTESMLIALAAGVLGLFLGVGAVRALLLLSPADLPRVGANGSAFTLDARMFLFALVVSAGSGILFGLLPALSASRADVMSLVKETDVQSGMGFRRGAGRSWLVILEIALALILLVGAGLLIRTFTAARTGSRGFDERNVLTVRMPLNGSQFDRTGQVAELVERAERRIRRIPGVLNVATTSALPLEPSLPIPFRVTRHDETQVGRYHGVAEWRSVSRDYFRTMGIRLLSGRFFAADDDGHAAGVVLINRIMMKKYWAEVDANPIGEFIIIGKGVSDQWEDVPRQVIGVVADVREAGMNREPMMYVPVAQVPDGLMAQNNRRLALTWVVRTVGERVEQGAIERELREASGLPLGRVRTMREVVAASSARSQFYVLVLSVFVVLAVLLAAVGIHGVMAYSVQQRTREIGLRMALGAEPDDLRNMVLWQAMKLALIGIGMGIPAAVALTRVLVSTIFGLEPWDPAVIGGVAVLLTAVALLAAYFPSVRAAEVSPCEALRQ